MIHFTPKSNLVVWMTLVTPLLEYTDAISIALNMYKKEVLRALTPIAGMCTLLTRNINVNFRL